MFALGATELGSRVLDLAAGPASFAAELTGCRRPGGMQTPYALGNGEIGGVWPR